MPAVQPSALVIDAQPGVAATGSVTLNLPPADRAVTAAITAGGDGFAVHAVAVTVQVWHIYTEEEIDELPPAMRAAARKARGYWDPQVTTSDGTTAFEVPAKAQVQVFVSATLPSVGVTTATLTLTGQVWGTVDVPVFAVVGTATATPVVSMNPLGLRCLPGDTATPSLTIQATPPATVMATLAPGSTGIEITQVTVRIPQRHDWTADELLDLPADMRVQAEKDGWIDWHDGPQGASETPLAVPPNSIVQVDLSITVPSTNVPDWITGTLMLLSTTWQTAEIPINVVVSDFSAMPMTDRISVQQGIPSEPFEVTLASRIGPDADVHFAIAAADAADVAVDVGATHLARNSSAVQPLQVTVAPNAVLGHYPIYLGHSVAVGLRVTAFGGIFDQQFPLGLTLLPGSVTVAALQGSIEGLQNSTATCEVRVISTGGIKELTMTAGALPAGVTMAPVSEQMTDAQTTTLTLSFAIGLDAPPGNAPISISWDAGDGVNAGALSLPLTVLLRPDSKTFSQEIATPTGTALGGNVAVTLDNSGNGTFSGAMRATGFPSYKFQVKVVIRSADGQIVIAQQQNGEGYGTDSSGDREFDWNEHVTSPLAASQWPAIRGASMAVSHAYELAGVLGTIEDIVVDWLEFLAGAALIAATGGAAAVIFMGAELADVSGLSLGPAGLPALVVTAGAMALLGPGVMIPVLVASTVIGDVAVKSRRLHPHEIASVHDLFGDHFPYDRVLLTNLKGAKGVEFTIPGVGQDILVNFGDGFDDAVAHVRGSYTVPGQLLAHELTHAWQIVHGGGDLDYYSTALVAKIAGQGAYYYGAPGPPWNDFGLEQQASIVDDWFAGTTTHATVRPDGWRGDDAPKDGQQHTDPYFIYIAGNILPGLE